jgi:hypothetical protein
MLISLPLRVLVDIIEHIPSLATGYCQIVVPYLIDNISNTDLTITCIKGLGVCALFGNMINLEKIISILLGVTGADRDAFQVLALDYEELDCDEVKDVGVSALFKVAIYTSGLSGGSGSIGFGSGEGVANKLLKYCFQNMPLTIELDEGKELHAFYIELLMKRDLRLLGGERLENLTQVPNPNPGPMTELNW